MARRKARVDFLFTVIELLFPCLTVEVLQGKTCQNHCSLERVGSVSAKISREGVVPREYFQFLEN